MAEAKNNNTLDPSSAKTRQGAARKRVLLADILGADQIVLATSPPAWGQQSLTDMQNAINAHCACRESRPRP